MSDTIKLVVEMPKEDYEFTKGARTARFFPEEYYVKLILNGTPLHKGKWIDKGFAMVGNNEHKYECSECGHLELDYPTHYADGIAKVSNYCPNCGAEMADKGGKNK